VVVIGVVVAPVAESHAVGVDAHEGFGLRDDGFIFVFALAQAFFAGIGNRNLLPVTLLLCPEMLSEKWRAGRL